MWLGGVAGPTSPPSRHPFSRGSIEGLAVGTVGARPGERRDVPPFVNFGRIAIFSAQSPAALRSPGAKPIHIGSRSLAPKRRRRASCSPGVARPRHRPAIGGGLAAQLDEVDGLLRRRGPSLAPRSQRRLPELLRRAWRIQADPTASPGGSLPTYSAPPKSSSPRTHLFPGSGRTPSLGLVPANTCRNAVAAPRNGLGRWRKSVLGVRRMAWHPVQGFAASRGSSRQWNSQFSLVPR